MKRNPDEDLRRLQRLADAGDAEAAARLRHVQRRVETFEDQLRSQSEEAERQVASLASMGYRVLFPEARRWRDLFLEERPRESLGPSRVHAEKPPVGWGFPIQGEDVTYTRSGKRRVKRFTVTIGPDVWLPGHKTAWVKARPEVLERIAQESFPVLGDHIRFEVTARDGGDGPATALITTNNSAIIGSRWLAIIPLADVPRFDVRANAGDERLRELHRAWSQTGDASLYSKLTQERERRGLLGDVEPNLAAAQAVIAAWPKLKRRNALLRPDKITYEQAEAVVRAYYRALGWSTVGPWEPGCGTCKHPEGVHGAAIVTIDGVAERRRIHCVMAGCPCEGFTRSSRGYPHDRDNEWNPLPTGSMVSPDLDRFAMLDRRRVHWREWYGPHPPHFPRGHWSSQVSGNYWETFDRRFNMQRHDMDKKTLARELLERALRTENPTLPNPPRGDERMRELERLVETGDDEARLSYNDEAYRRNMPFQPARFYPSGEVVYLFRNGWKGEVRRQGHDTQRNPVFEVWVYPPNGDRDLFRDRASPGRTHEALRMIYELDAGLTRTE